MVFRGGKVYYDLMAGRDDWLGKAAARRALALCALLVACAAPVPDSSESPPPPSRPVEKEASGARQTLMRLGNDALAQGELDVAEQRFRRVLEGGVPFAPAHAGLGRVALRRGERAEARARFEAALEIDPSSLAALLGLAEVDLRDGDRAASRRALERALRLDPTRPLVHERLAALTGNAPREEVGSLDAALARVDRHPYDPWALVRAGEALVRAGRPADAVSVLEKVVWLTDLDTESGATALRLLPKLSKKWRELTLVPVHVYADEGVRARPAWRFQQRMVWVAATNALMPLFQTYFVPVTIDGFSSARASDELESIHKAFWLDVGDGPGEGILAAFTARPARRGRGYVKLGVAQLLGRRLTVRLPAGARESRVLAHEILHLYGAIHVVDDVDSLMNPTGVTFKLDRYNVRIVRATRGRNFATGNLHRDVFAHADLGETIDAYVAGLRVNLSFRELGIEQVLSTRQLSRYQAAAEAEEVTALDPHLADVSRAVAQLMLADGRRVEAVGLLEMAAKLYGRRTKRGREAFADAERLRRALVEELLE